MSIAEPACWDPATRHLSQLPPLPGTRSTHDAEAHEGKIYVARRLEPSAASAPAASGPTTC